MSRVVAYRELAKFYRERYRETAEEACRNLSAWRSARRRAASQQAASHKFRDAFNDATARNMGLAHQVIGLRIENDQLREQLKTERAKAALVDAPIPYRLTTTNPTNEEVSAHDRT